MKSPRRTSETIPSDENPYRVLPQVSSVVDALAICFDVSPDLCARIVRAVLDDIRAEIESGERPSAEAVLDRCRAALAALSETRFEEIINGTGIVLHTNLGRSPVSEATAAAMATAAGVISSARDRSRYEPSRWAHGRDQPLDARTNWRRSHAGRQQQCGRRAVDSRGSLRGTRCDRLPRRSHRDRGRLSHSRGCTSKRMPAHRNRDDKPHLCRRLRARMLGIHRRVP